MSTWRLTKGRITIAARELPVNPSLSEVDTLEGARENQRVEISSSDYPSLLRSAFPIPHIWELPA